MKSQVYSPIPDVITTKHTEILTTGARRHGTSAQRTPSKKRQVIAICQKPYG